MFIYLSSIVHHKVLQIIFKIFLLIYYCFYCCMQKNSILIFLKPWLTLTKNNSKYFLTALEQGFSLQLCNITALDFFLNFYTIKEIVKQSSY